ncbi:O-antigen ligase family protein [Pseudokordiimonas caeni]|uniref:O-antigen ligase family protein n=1 Tax=Pseudokordiimonas caeni TaxID=2997908 RepID=UPI002811B74E|nr:O-antigen ligase family protein [Pseudokordiimonas caeni]
MNFLRSLYTRLLVQYRLYRMKLPAARPYMRYSQGSRFINRAILYLSFFVVALVGSFLYGYTAIYGNPQPMLQFMGIPVVILALMCIWALPERASWGEKALYPLLIAYFFFALVWAQYVSIIKVPGNPWLSPQRVLLYIISGIALISFSVSREMKGLIKERYQAHKPIFVCLIILITIELLSLGLTSNMRLSLSYIIRETMLITIPFLLCAALFQDAARVRLFIAIAMVSIVILVAFAYQESRLNQPVWAVYIPHWWFDTSDETIQRLLTGRSRYDRFRAKSSSLTSLEFAELLAVLFPFCLYYLLERRRMILRGVGAIMTIICLVGIYFSGSRLGFVGAIAAFGTYLFLFGLRYWRTHRKSLIGPALIAFYPATMTTLLVGIAVSPRLSAMVIGGSSTDASTQARFDQWQMGLPMIMKNPFIGYGYANGAYKLGFVNPGGELTIDTFYLSILLETGVPGALAFFFFHAIAAWVSAKAYLNSTDTEGKDGTRIGAAIACALVGFLIVKLVLSQRTNHTFLAILVGFAVALYRNKKNEVKQENGA